MCKQIVLSRGEVVLVDDEDFVRVSAAGWAKRPDGYAGGRPMVDGQRKSMLMHRFIVGAQPGEVWDHINGTKLDNRRSNLRLSSPGNNGHNRASWSSSGYKGVHFCAGANRFQVHIKHEGRKYHGGIWDTAEEAASAYDQAARILFGDFARTNFPFDPAVPPQWPRAPRRRRGVAPRTWRNETHKECSICHEIKPRSEFSPIKGAVEARAGGRNVDLNESRCRICHSARRSLYPR